MPSVKIIAIAAAATLASFVSAALEDRLDVRVVDSCHFAVDPESCYEQQTKASTIYGNMPTIHQKSEDGIKPELNARITNPCTYLFGVDESLYEDCKSRAYSGGAVY